MENLNDELKEEIILEDTQLSKNNVENSLNYDLLLPEEQKEVNELIENMNISDTNAIIQYGANVQEEMASFSDGVINNVRTKNIDEVGNILSGLVSTINDFDSVTAIKDKNFLQKLWDKGKNNAEKIVASYSKVETNVNKICNELEKNKIKMLKDITIFENMFEKNTEFFKKISLYIIAIEKKLEILKKEELPKLEEIAQKTNESIDLQKLNDLKDVIFKLEKKVYDLKITRVISIQMAPQIRMLQKNETALAEKIQSAIVNTIPLWKSQLLLALGVANSKVAYQVQNNLSDATNELLQKNSELLKQGTIDIAKASERSIVDIETLRITNKNIIETIEEVIRVHQEGEKSRQLAEKEITDVENKLKSQLDDISGKEIKKE